MIIPMCPSWAPLLKNLARKFSRVFEELAIPVAKLALIFDANYCYIPSTESVDEAGCCLKDLTTSLVAKEDICLRLLKDYGFINNYRPFSSKIWCPSDAGNLFENISSIFFATARDYRCFPGECCENDQAANLNVFEELVSDNKD